VGRPRSALRRQRGRPFWTTQSQLRSRFRRQGTRPPHVRSSVPRARTFHRPAIIGLISQRSDSYGRRTVTVQRLVEDSRARYFSITHFEGSLPALTRVLGRVVFETRDGLPVGPFEEVKNARADFRSDGLEWQEAWPSLQIPVRATERYLVRPQLLSEHAPPLLWRRAHFGAATGRLAESISFSGLRKRATWRSRQPRER